MERAKNKYSYKKKNIYTRLRRRTNPNVNIKDNLNRSLRRLVKGVNVPSLIPLLGCTKEEFKFHLESCFKEGMTWENYGFVWQIDHEKPCAVHNLLDFEERKRCYHYSNLKPLFKEENLKKSYKLLTV